jgi:LysM repeat protein
LRTLATGAAVVAASVTFGVTANGAASAYTVQPGDTLTRIASRWGTTSAELARVNGLSNPDQLAVGQVLVVPGEGGTTTGAGSTTSGLSYTVRPGDTLNAISRRFGVAVWSIQTANSIANPNVLAVGQVLRIPLTPAPGPDRPTTVEPLANPGGTVPTTTTAPPRNDRLYTVVGGDTLYSVARRFGVTVDALKAANHLSDVNSLAIGQVLVIPGGGATTNPVTPTPTTVPTTPTTAPPNPPTAPATSTLPTALFGSTATDPARQALVPMFNRWADTYQVPRDLVKGLAFVESGWRNDAVSSSGAIGIGQLMPDTARWVATTLIGVPTLDSRNPDDNIRMTARYLRYLLDLQKDEAKAIGSYYQGAGSVNRNGIQPVTERYIERVQAARAYFR